MAELNITFAGICTSIHETVPGVPLRVVLPDATAVRYGIVRIPGPDGHLHNVAYYLMPHIAIARDRAVGGRHLVLTASHLEIENAKSQPLCVQGGGFRLAEYKSGVELSPEVVFEGYALAYFDIFGGRVWTDGKGDEPRVLRVSIKTDGTPKIVIRPLPKTILPQDMTTTIETHELYVTNLDIDGGVEDTHFDFLGNYLVTRRGIPRQLDKRTPGMPAEPAALTNAHFGERLKALGLLFETEGTVSGWRASVESGQEPGLVSPPATPSLRSIIDDLLWGGDLASPLMIDPTPLSQSCSYGQYP